MSCQCSCTLSQQPNSLDFGESRRTMWGSQVYCINTAAIDPYVVLIHENVPLPYLLLLPIFVHWGSSILNVEEVLLLWRLRLTHR
jgi:hypothetical protein